MTWLYVLWPEMGLLLSKSNNSQLATYNNVAKSLGHALFVGFMVFIRKFPGGYEGRQVITITHYTHVNIIINKI